MLPATKSSRPSLAEVMPSSLSAILGEDNSLGLPPVDRVVVVVVDGLGANTLSEKAGHARTMAAAFSKTATAVSGFPTTTASGLATITTGTSPGVHGMVGYTSLDPDHDRVVQLLTGWDADLDPATFQRADTVFERAAQRGVAPFAVGIERFRDSGFTSAVLRGAEFHSGVSIADRVGVTRGLLDRHDAALVYLYASEFDHAAHNHGRESAKALLALEEIDSAISALVKGLGPREGVLLVADHGSLDVLPTAHILFDREPGLLDGVRHVAGEPRALQLHFEPDASPALRKQVLDRWRAAEGGRSLVVTRREAIEEGWFGAHVEAAVEPRIGDVIVAARKAIAYYDSRTATAQARAMIGQHGSLSAEETRVPLLRFGAFNGPRRS